MELIVQELGVVRICGFQTQSRHQFQVWSWFVADNPYQSAVQFQFPFICDPSVHLVCHVSTRNGVEFVAAVLKVLVFAA